MYTPRYTGFTAIHSFLMLKAMRVLADNGIQTGVTMMPILPFIEDTEENVTATSWKKQRKQVLLTYSSGWV